MRRTILGILAIVFLVLGTGLYFLNPSQDAAQAFAAAGIRVGMVLGAFWLAYPQLMRIPWWLVQISLVLLLIIAALPRPVIARAVLAFAIPLLIALWIVRPRKKRKPIARRTSRAAERERT